MNQVHYVYLADTWKSQRTVSREAAEREVGQRVMIGFDLWRRYVNSPTGEQFVITVFQSEITGKVWAVYMEEINP